ncbi:MAG: lipoyl synthase [Gammaproteobacteria bacterium]|nr:lipoyl synthase [Gammaproteobacteria bacterium]MYD80188.1 lipoyl synthase [Gammaproteobacteria bacterium]
MSDSASSGEKYRTRHGFTAIRDGISASHARKLIPTADCDATTRKPPWLRVELPHGPKYRNVQSSVVENSLHTVCAESHCPNIGECWSNGTATLMLLGSVCTRACRFCAVDTGNPKGWLDHDEPQNCARAVALMNLRYVVLTSVDRDDLEDGGAAHYAACILAIHDQNPSTTIEALTPDFRGDFAAVEVVVSTPVKVFAQNLETVERLTSRVRDPRAGYDQTLRVLAHAKSVSEVRTKSSLMLGLGETDEEIRQAFEDLRSHDVDFLTLGQYLRPTKNHLPVSRWVRPDEFEDYRQTALNFGFQDVAAGPLVRSSYRADRLSAQL